MPRGVYDRKKVKKVARRTGKDGKAYPPVGRRKNKPGVSDDILNISASELRSSVRSELIPKSTLAVITGGDHHQVVIKKGDSLTITFV